MENSHSQCIFKNAKDFLTANNALIYQVVVAILSIAFLYKILFNRKNITKRAKRDIGISPASNGTGQKIDCVNPATGKSMGIVNSLKPDEVKTCLEAAQKAQVEWGQTTFDERRQILQDFIDMFIKHENELVEASMRDTGKTSKFKFYIYFIFFFKKKDYRLLINFFFFLKKDLKQCLVKF